MEKDKFKLLYSITYKAGEFKTEDIETYGKETQLCDSFIFIALYKCENREKMRISLNSFDGESKKPLKGKEFWVAWAALGHHIAEDKSLTDKERQIAKWAAESIMNESKKINH
jgi:hypothetical protein